MTGASLNDASQRELVRTSLHRDLFVEAGAGTGKTTEMVARIVNLIGSGQAEVQRLVAITFTEAASSELKERIRSSLESVAVGDDLAAKRCRRALESLDEAMVGTIHSFARAILQRHSSEAGLPPVFEIRDGVRARVVRQQLWRRFVARTFSSSQPLETSTEELLRSALAFGLTVSHAAQLAAALHDHWEKLPGHGPHFGVPPVEVGPVIYALDELLRLRSECSVDSDRLAIHLDTGIAPWRQELAHAAAAGRYEVLSALVHAPSLKAGKGAKANWESITAVRAAVESVADQRRAALEPVRHAIVQGLVALVGAHVVQSAGDRVTAGELEFHDLLVVTRNLVRDSRRVREHIRDSYSHLFVDEFQDTDPLQAEILDLLTGTNGPQRFSVGDPRQSIYRFRGADVAQYVSVRDSMSPDEVLGLGTNFRTAAPVLQWIDAVTNGLGRVAQSVKHQTGLHAGRMEKGPASVTLVGGEVEANSAVVRDEEADLLARQLRTMVDSGWGVASDNTNRPLQYSDVAVLTPTRAPLPSLERAFRRHGVPFRVESRSMVWATQEVRDVLAVLAAIGDPGDQRSLIASLRSPAFGCSDADLLAWRRAGGSWNYLDRNATGTGVQRVASAMKWLQRRHQARYAKSVTHLVEDVIADRSLMELAFARDRQRETWRRLQFVVDRARSWNNEGGYSLRDFLAWAQVQSTSRADALESVVPESDDDAVRIMTIHAAKGLEFPAVVVAGLNTDLSITTGVKFVWDNHNWECRLGNAQLGLETEGFADRWVQEDDQEKDESDRLLYVALTRARDHLVVGVHRTKDKDKKLAARMAGAAAGIHAPANFEPVPTAPSEVELPVAVSSAIADHAEARSRAVSLAHRVSSLSGSRINGLIAGEPPAAQLSDGPSRQERMAFGTAVHWILETIDLLDPVALDGLVLRAAALGGLEHRTADLRKSVQLALGSVPVSEATSGEFWREMSVAGWRHGCAVSGTLDLVYRRPDGLVIVDYKTEVMSDEGGEEHARHYQWQLLTYAQLVAETTGEPVSQVSLLMIGPDQDWAHSVPIRVTDAKLAELDHQLGKLTKSL